ncbi:hypothetical protein PFISCL1PPCAC_9565, partial [Pristionchus fissidentatus]
DNKKWHDDVTDHLRIHLIGKVVTAIFPFPDHSSMHDQRIKDLIAYARKVEKDMFENAADQVEYYALLAEKIHKIRVKLEKRKVERCNALRGANGGSPMCRMDGGNMMQQLQLQHMQQAAHMEQIRHQRVHAANTNIYAPGNSVSVEAREVKIEVKEEIMTD